MSGTPITRRLARVAVAVAVAGSALLAFAPAQAATDCPMLPLTEVAKAFNDPEARLDHADPAGFCHWLVHDGILSASVHRRPAEMEATLFFLSFKTNSFAALTRNAANPKIGQLAYFGMSANGKEGNQDDEREAGFMSLNGNTLFVLTYSPRDIPDAEVAAPMIALGAIGIRHAASASQTYGECEWFSKDDIKAMLGAGEVTVHRMGDRHCTASLPNGSTLAMMSNEDPGDAEFADLMAQEKAHCKVVPLPQLGLHAMAQSACAAPGNTAMTIHLRRNGAMGMLVFSPSTRAAKDGDLKKLLPIAERAWQRLGK